jgi:hypothetical protein
MSSSVAAVFGQLPTTPFDWTIDRSCRADSIGPLSLPNDLRFKAMIQQCCSRVTKLMSGDLETCDQELGNDRSMAMQSWITDLANLDGKLDTIEILHGQDFSSTLSNCCDMSKVELMIQ